MADNKLIGHNYQTPDIVAKVTGRAKYSEDFRAEGMLFCKLLLSPMPHARVRSIDASEALKMPGVYGILTADDMPTAGSPRPAAPPTQPQGAPPPPNVAPEVALTNEPLYEGEPILALAAVDELTAADAIEKISLDLELLPFCVDPLKSLHPDGPNARREGNVWVRNQVQTLKWTADDWREVEAGRLPLREAPDGWQVGDLEAGFREAALIIDETVVHQSTSHEPMEPRTAMAYWQNGKLYLHCSTQSIAQNIPYVAQLVGIKPSDLVVVSEYCGGGFGSKNPPAVPSMAIPALLARKIQRPVMMRISRDEEYYIGRARAGLHMRAKIGFRKDGRITAMDLFIVQDNGAHARQGDAVTCAVIASANYQPPAMRFRGTTVITNTPPRSPQRAPGGEQSMAMLEPLMSKAARQLGIDQVDIRKINAPTARSPFGAPNAQGVQQSRLSSAFAREALDRGAELFNWEERKRRSGQRRGSRITGVAATLGNFTAGDAGYDGLLVLRPDGRLSIHQGIGNLGSLSIGDTARVAAEVLGMPWDKCEVIWGDSGKHVPWSSRQGGSRTIYAHTRANHAASMDLRHKLQEIAAQDLGGSPENYEVADEYVVDTRNRSRRMSFAQAASRAVVLGGKYDGHELPADINAITKASAMALAGLGLMGVAKDNYPHDGVRYSFAAGFAEVEVDVETGAYRIVDYLVVADVGTVIHPHGLEGQLHGGAVQGFGHAKGQKWVYDQHYGLPLAKRFHYSKPPTILDIPLEMHWEALDIPDPQTPVGAKGIGETAIGIGVAAVKCALADAIGDEYVNLTPVTLDAILSSLEAGKRVDTGLTTHI